jgi:hypothetical protein
METILVEMMFRMQIRQEEINPLFVSTYISGLDHYSDQSLDGILCYSWRREQFLQSKTLQFILSFFANSVKSSVTNR